MPNEKETNRAITLAAAATKKIMDLFAGSDKATEMLDAETAKLKAGIQKEIEEAIEAARIHEEGAEQLRRKTGPQYQPNFEERFGPKARANKGPEQQ